MEAHGGSTYCAVASLYLMGKLGVLTEFQKDKLIRWCALRLNVGYQVYVLCLFATNPLLNLVLELFMKFNSARN
jgi:hypothetical protein